MKKHPLRRRRSGSEGFPCLPVRGGPLSESEWSTEVQPSPKRYGVARTDSTETADAPSRNAMILLGEMCSVTRECMWATRPGTMVKCPERLLFPHRWSGRSAHASDFLPRREARLGLPTAAPRRSDGRAAATGWRDEIAGCIEDASRKNRNSTDGLPIVMSARAHRRRPAWQ
jgi:hypothetical protein